MSFIRKKKMKSGIICAYQVTSVWVPEKKQARQISKYLGIINSDGEIIPKGTSLRGRPKKCPQQSEGVLKEKMVLDFGEAFFASECIKNSSIYNSGTELFKRYPELVALIAYRLCYSGPMYNCHLWLNGNILSKEKNNQMLTSQNISRIIAALGEDELQRTFFKNYLQDGHSGSKNIIIDATSLPNQINSDFNAWGYCDGHIEQQFRFHCVVDQENKKPLFYRYVAGNISDINALKATVDELKSLGVEQSFVLLDAGYCSEENLKILREYRISFLTRLPAGRKLYKNMIIQYGYSLENLENFTTFGKRTLFIKKILLEDLYGEKGYVYLVLDPERKTKDIQALSKNYELNEIQKNTVEINYAFQSAGIFILISSKDIPVQEVMQAYYTRQSIEQIFGFSKNNLELLPIRHHTEETVKGYLFLQFLVLVVFIEIREKLSGKVTVEQAFMILRTLKCKIYESRWILQELTKKQKQIFEAASIIVPDLNPGI